MASTKPKLWIYLDYNGVLNQEGARALGEFILKLNFLDDWFGIDTVIVLLSFRKGAYKCNCTLNEIADAGVLNLFQKLVFTAVRSNEEEGRPVDSMRCAIVEEFEYEPLSPHEHPGLPASPRNQDPDEFRARQRIWAHAEAVEDRTFFRYFYGGKDQFIYLQHLAPPATEMLRRVQMLGSICRDRIIFVDDKWVNVAAVRALNQLPSFRGHVQCIQMRKRDTLQGLYAQIEYHAQALQNNHAAERRWNAWLSGAAHKHIYIYIYIYRRLGG